MYSFFLDGEQLPVTPEKLTVKIKGSNKTLTLVNEGDINFLRAPGLTEISFDAVLPMLGQYHFAQSGRKPDYYLCIFEKLMTGKRPFRFIVRPRVIFRRDFVRYKYEGEHGGLYDYRGRCKRPGRNRCSHAQTVHKLRNKNSEANKAEKR